jgi:cytoskeletal protein RodZ
MSLLGERLKQERESRGISVFQAEIDTRIRAAVLEMMEKGDYAHLPPEPFLRGLIRSYANYLRMNPQDALELLSVDLITPQLPPAPPRPPPPKTVVPPPRNLPEPAQSYVAIPTSAPESSVSLPASSQSAAHWFEGVRQLNVPLPVMISVAVVVAFACVICGVIAFTQFSSLVLPSTASRATTSTRPPATNTPTLVAGAAPTSVPILPVTAVPFPTFPGNASATPRPIPRRTIEVQTGLNVDVDANGSIKVLVGIDNVPVFNAIMDPGTTRSWTGKESVYVRIENASAAVLYFNGKEQLPGVFAERTIMERRWVLDKGTPVRTAPFTPAPPTATRAPTTTPVHTITPTSFDAPPRTPTPF